MATLAYRDHQHRVDHRSEIVSQADGEAQQAFLMEPLQSLAPLVKRRQVVLIGEWHGTNEFPKLVFDLAAAAVGRGLAVTVGLEIACSEQQSFDGLALDRGLALDGPWWRRSPEFSDGRSSAAMAELVIGLAGLVHQGGDVVTVAMDGPWVAPGSPVPLELLHLLEQPRDDVMGGHVLDAIDRRPTGLTIILAGSEHTRMRTASPGLEPTATGGPRTLGTHVLAWHPGAVSLLGRASGGTAWCITGQNEPGEAKPVPDDADLPVGALWAGGPGEDGHHGYVHVGPVSASHPFVPET